MTTIEVTRLLQVGIGKAILAYWPFSLAAFGSGFAVTLVQSWLKLSDISLSFLPKLMAVGLTLVLFLYALVGGFALYLQDLAAGLPVWLNR